ncbi:MAG TPA: SMP-30/gluconolactonase/LRE family protein, partial [Thermoanaerobaculia bacterium]|nr:SMP-30/gluconolactonase/LRE family protein [Thermoanaerobaculia bacterium]
MRTGHRFLAVVGVFVSIGFSAPGLAQGPDEAARLHRAAIEAHRAKDWAGFLANTKKEIELRPGRPGLLYNLACAEALNGHQAEAARALATLLQRGIDFGAEADDDLASLRASAEWPALRTKLEKLKAPVSTSVPAFRLAEKDLLTEGLAYDPKTRAFFISSVRKRKIVRRAPDGTVTDFVATGKDGLFGVLALLADEKRRELWATSTAVPQMEGFAKDLEGKAGVFRYDLDSGRLVAKVLLTPDGKRHNLNDLTLDAKGDAYVSDPAAGVVYRLARGKGELETFLPAGVVRSPQGLALSKDGKSLYVADYGEGIVVVDLATKAARPLAAPADVPLMGVDGLVRHGDSLLVTQNGIRPYRVVRL